MRKLKFSLFNKLNYVSTICCVPVSDLNPDVAECCENAQLLIALVHLPLLVFGLPYILWCVSCLRRVVAFWLKPGVFVVVVANSNTNLRMCNNISNASLVHYNYWCAYYPDTCHGHSSIRITLNKRHGHTNLALISLVISNKDDFRMYEMLRSHELLVNITFGIGQLVVGELIAFVSEYHEFPSILFNLEHAFESSKGNSDVKFPLTSVVLDDFLFKYILNFNDIVILTDVVVIHRLNT
ncbi:hypothetical protein AGLY_013966 [Aphis glycines]|uniref:Uncharacterized protein n=1 Tax=Aphis glycines TaxID=307491 RepID=A0A6G0T4Q1_APHGL|nr:hypothetical protein AGLY_013966 [Aphis glycines]